MDETAASAPSGPASGQGPGPAFVARDGSLPADRGTATLPGRNAEPDRPGRTARPDQTPSHEPAPASTFVYGPCRPLVNLLLYAAAQRTGARFHWLDIREPAERSPGPDPAELGWIDPAHLWSVDPAEAFAPDNAGANAALFELVREDEAPEILTRLTEFLRLPPRLREILARDPATAGPGAIAVANADRSGRSCDDASLPPILEALSGAGFALLVGYGGAPPNARAWFSNVLRVDGDRLDRWTEATLTLERGAAADGLRAGEPVRLGELPFVRGVVARALGPT